MGIMDFFYIVLLSLKFLYWNALFFFLRAFTSGLWKFCFGYFMYGMQNRPPPPWIGLILKMFLIFRQHAASIYGFVCSFVSFVFRLFRLCVQKNYATLFDIARFYLMVPRARKQESRLTRDINRMVATAWRARKQTVQSLVNVPQRV